MIGARSKRGLTELKGYEKIGGGPIVTIAMDPNNYRQVYVSDTNNKVWASSDEGATWADLTATLGKLTSQVTTIEIFRAGSERFESN